MDIDLLREMVAQEIPDVVRLWMRWMMLIFFASIAFMVKFKPARWAFITVLATVALGLATWAITKNIHLFGLPHLIVWTPLAIYLWKSTLSPAARAAAPLSAGAYSKAHLIWATLLFITIIISLVFDVRDLYLVMTGVK